jgi:hypothetical protein
VRTHAQPAEQSGAEEQQQQHAAAPPTPGSAKGAPQPASSPRAFSPRGRTSGSWTPSAQPCLLAPFMSPRPAIWLPADGQGSTLDSE